MFLEYQGISFKILKYKKEVLHFFKYFVFSNVPRIGHEQKNMSIDILPHSFNFNVRPTSGDEKYALLRIEYRIPNYHVRKKKSPKITCERLLSDKLSRYTVMNFGRNEIITDNFYYYIK